jgi:PEP-CTERM motif
MKHPTSVIVAGAAILASLAFAATSIATPINDEYFIETYNFPGTIFPATTPLTFNHTGDLTAEEVPGSNGELLVTEQVLGFLPTGELALKFQFDLLRTPPDNLNAGFAFRIIDLDFGNTPEFVLAGLRVQFDAEDSGLFDATMFVTPTYEPDGGLTLTLFTPPGVTWLDVVGHATPRAMTINFFSGTRVPEPSTLLLLGSSLLGALTLLRRRPR